MYHNNRHKSQEIKVVIMLSVTVTINHIHPLMTNYYVQDILGNTLHVLPHLLLTENL